MIRHRFFLLLLPLLMQLQLAAQHLTSPYAPQSWVVAQFLLNDSSGRPLRDIYIQLRDKQTHEVYTIKTNGNGRAALSLAQGHSFWIELPGIPDFDELTVPPNVAWPVNVSLRYQTPKQFLSEPTTSTVSYSKNYRPASNAAEVIVYVSNHNSEPLEGIRVRLRSGDETVLESYTDRAGATQFLTSLDKTYAIDLDQLKNYSSVTVPDEGGYSIMSGVYMEPVTLREIVENDSVRQQFPKQPKKDVNRAYVQLIVKDSTGQAVSKASVFLDCDSSSVVYTAVTDSSGAARFLLPKGFDYTLHVNGQRDRAQVWLKTTEDFRQLAATPVRTVVIAAEH